MMTHKTVRASVHHGFPILMILFAFCSSISAVEPPLTINPERFELAGMQAGRQLLVTLADSQGRPHDCTRTAQYRVEPAGIVKVSTQGFVRPTGMGSAVITVQAAGQTRTIRVTVRDYDEKRPLHFTNDIEPILTRRGCNAGGCHGKASGQNGFKLSLFGFDPSFDYNAIVKEARGRRVFPAAPDQSLFLAKPAGRLPHGGGKRLD
ncbi:MAG TPA: S-layer protein, partial [Gemmataceae bacterium]|nr:S-layer protein [Gemmataceae bacterium]